MSSLNSLHVFSQVMYRKAVYLSNIGALSSEEQIAGDKSYISFSVWYLEEK